MKRPRVCIVCPATTRQPHSRKFHRELDRVRIASANDFDAHVLYVDDGSTDSTLALLNRPPIATRQFRSPLSRNFGQQIALWRIAPRVATR